MMIYLTGSIVLTSYLTLSFKACEIFRINVFQAIVFNYITCVITGSLVNGSFPVHTANMAMPWFRWACVMGAMFVGIFNIVALTAQKNGVAVASVANKLSLIIPVILSVCLYNETVAGWKAAGVVLALVAVVFTCYSPRINDAGQNKRSLLVYMLPLVLFLSSGLLDALINHVQLTYVTEENNNDYLVSSFFSAATIGSLVLFTQFVRKKQRFKWKNLLAGVLIGIPNYFSIWCLIHFLKQSSWQTSASIPVNNMGIVLFSAVVAWLLYKERLSKINWMGVLLSLLAIYLIAFGDQL